MSDVTRLSADAPAQPSRDASPAGPWVIAHRGASAYAPENTLPAFRTAIDQRATFIELDVQRTRDDVVVCLHDLTLDRTTDVAARFPDRARPAAEGAPRFWLEDFTAAEVRQLDAGAWFGPAFAGTHIPTLDEALTAVRGRAGLYIELKEPDRQPGIERQVLDVLRRHGLATPWADPATPIVVQSFSLESLERFAALASGLPLHFLFGARDAGRWLEPAALARVRRSATGLSPEKGTWGTHGPRLREVQQAGLRLTPWTFRATQPAAGHVDVRAEMRHFVEVSGVDGLITDNPDLASHPHGGR